jgi:hypothetical protein
MSPTVFRYGSYRFYFFSREESRMHVHVLSPNGEAKFWLEPDIELAVAKGLSSHALSEIRDIIEQRREEIRHAWHRHFSD